MLREPGLSLHAPGLKICSPLAFSCQHQSPRNSSGIEPRIAWAWAGCYCAATMAAAAMNLFIGFSYSWIGRLPFTPAPSRGKSSVRAAR